MRMLFLPACLCLVTWSGSTNPEARFTLDEFTGKSLAHAATAETSGRAASEDLRDDVRAETRDAKPSIDIKIPDDAVVAVIPPAPTESASLAPDAKSADDILSNLAIEYPVPSGVVVNNGIPAGIPLPPIAKPVIARSTEEICDTLTKSAQINDLPAPFFIRLLFQESGFRPGVVSSAGAQGIAQFMPATAIGMGVDNPFDPRQAIPASARLLNDLLQQFGNLGLAAAAYNAGPKRIVDWLNSKGKGKLPEETQGYVKIITGKPVEHWTSAEAKHPGAKLPKRAPCQESAGLLAWNGPDIVPMPQPSPLRAAPGKTPEKGIVVAATVRADMRHADRAERLAEAAKSAKPSAIKTAALQMKAARSAKTAKVADKTADKTTEKPVAKAENKASHKAAAKRRIKTADIGQKPADGEPQKIAQQ